MRMKLTKAVVGLGLAGALLLGAGAAGAPPAGGPNTAATAPPPPPTTLPRSSQPRQGPFVVHGDHHRPERPAERPDRRHPMSRPERVAR